MWEGKKLAFIGGGNMGSALIKGVLKAGLLDPSRILVSDISEERLGFLSGEYGVRTFNSNKEVVNNSDVIILAVKPQVMSVVLQDIRDVIGDEHLLVSIMAGVKLASISSVLGKEVPMIRVMPNTPALVLEGASAIACGSKATGEHRELALSIFSAVGEVVEVEEKLLDAVTGLSGSGPAYILLVIEALTDGGVMAGLPRPVASRLAIQTTLGAAKLMAETSLHSAALKDQITSPGGTTIYGLEVLESGGARGLLMRAVQAAARRSEELGKK